MIAITKDVISPEQVINSVRVDPAGCVVTYVGLIRNVSQGREVFAVEYEDTGTSESTLHLIDAEARREFPVEDIAFVHRVGKLHVGDINLVIAVAAAHREEGFAACQYAIDMFKNRLPTRKTESYADGSSCTG